MNTDTEKSRALDILLEDYETVILCDTDGNGFKIVTSNEDLNQAICVAKYLRKQGEIGHAVLLLEAYGMFHIATLGVREWDDI